MKLKEKCIYYNPVQGGYYLALVVDNEMVYGRTGDFAKTSFLENWINQNRHGLSFKIEDIIIHGDYIRNYYLNAEVLEKFELVKELTDKEFYLIESLIDSNYRHSSVIVDVHKHMNDVSNIVNEIKYKKSEMKKIDNDIHALEKMLLISINKNKV